MSRLLSGSFAVLLLALLCCRSSSAFAQVFYEPVRYQYGSGAGTFYYGGHNPRVLDFASMEIRRQSYYSSVTIEPVVHRTHVYSDTIPFRDLADDSYTSYGSYTANDARNEAYNNVPRYFRKRDLLRAAVITRDGSIVVPAQAHPRMDMVTPSGTTQPVPKGTILIIPKDLLKQPVKKVEPSLVMDQ